MSVFEVESPEQWVEEVFPDGRPKEISSSDYLRENPLDWSVSRSRMLKIAIRTADEEMVKIALYDYAYLVGIGGAFQTFMEIWGNLVMEDMMSNSDDDLDE